VIEIDLTHRIKPFKYKNEEHFCIRHCNDITDEEIIDSDSKGKILIIIFDTYDEYESIFKRCESIVGKSMYMYICIVCQHIDYTFKEYKNYWIEHLEKEYWN